MTAGFEDLQSLLERVRHELHKVIIGQDAVIDKALAFDRGNRWQDADEMRSALRLACSRVEPPLSLPPPSV